MVWKNYLKSNYRNAQKLFDKKFRSLKRQYKKKDFEELSEAANTNPVDMWAKLKRLCDPPSTRAALEIVRQDGTISQDMQEILEKWYVDISRLFSGLRENPEIAFNEDFYNDVLNKKDAFEKLSPEEQSAQTEYDSDVLNSDLSYEEVSKAIDSTKLKKSLFRAAKRSNKK